jgi:RimJ/RimL family protein N-acetyltransferase
MEHAAELWPAAAEPELWKYMIFEVGSLGDLEAWIGKRLEAVEAGTALAFLQRDARSGQAFGSTSIFDISPHRTMEVGHTWIGASHRRTPANTEAKLLLLSHCFAVRKAIRVQLKCDERNLRSRKAIERLGARFEGVVRNQMVLPDGHRRNACVYSILDSEWPGVEARLRSILAPSAPTPKTP